MTTHCRNMEQSFRILKMILDPIFKKKDRVHDSYAKRLTIKLIFMILRVISLQAKVSLIKQLSYMMNMQYSMKRLINLCIFDTRTGLLNRWKVGKRTFLLGT